jgi:hypothetical protein
MDKALPDTGRYMTLRDMSSSDTGAIESPETDRTLHHVTEGMGSSYTNETREKLRCWFHYKGYSYNNVGGGLLGIQPAALWLR